MYTSKRLNIDKNPVTFLWIVAVHLINSVRDTRKQNSSCVPQPVKRSMVLRCGWLTTHMFIAALCIRCGNQHQLSHSLDRSHQPAP